MGTLQKAKVDEDGVHLPVDPAVAVELLGELGYDAPGLTVHRVEHDRYVVSDEVNGAYMVLFLWDPVDRKVHISTQAGWDL